MRAEVRAGQGNRRLSPASRSIGASGAAPAGIRWTRLRRVLRYLLVTVAVFQHRLFAIRCHTLGRDFREIATGATAWRNHLGSHLAGHCSAVVRASRCSRADCPRAPRRACSPAPSGEGWRHGGRGGTLSGRVLFGATASRRELAGSMGGHRVGTAWPRRERLRFLPGGLLVGQRFS
jgi:hypothetical protein